MNQSAAYAGDISATEAWELLSGTPTAVLVDVRTEAEWTYVGIPDLSPLGRGVLFCEWQSFPEQARNPHFVEEVSAALSTAGQTAGQPLVLLCRSGTRSRAAAIAMTEAGFGPCFNIQDGFEGGLDPEGHRGVRAGWKAEGLPWSQS